MQSLRSKTRSRRRRTKKLQTKRRKSHPRSNQPTYLKTKENPAKSPRIAVSVTTKICMTTHQMEGNLPKVESYRVQPARLLTNHQQRSAWYAKATCEAIYNHLTLSLLGLAQR